jgi:hypothetical protein
MIQKGRAVRTFVLDRLAEALTPGHVFCSFLALVLKMELEERIATLNRLSSWPEIIADLDSLTETEIEYVGKHFIVRSATFCRQCRAAADHPRCRDLLNSASSKM